MIKTNVFLLRKIFSMRNNRDLFLQVIQEQQYQYDNITIKDQLTTVVCRSKTKSFHLVYKAI